MLTLRPGAIFLRDPLRECIVVRRLDVIPRITIIADDLTGALDVAGPFASRGQPTFGVINVAHDAIGQIPDAAVVSINTASRHLPAADAARCVQAAVKHWGRRMTGICIKKIDSTLRGQVAVESLALARALGRLNLIVTPAFPAQGRTLRQGMVYVDGVPLPQTGFGRDALSPPPREPLDRVFAAAAPDASVRNVAPCGPFDLARAGEATRVFLVESETDADLAACVKTLAPHLADCLFVGSAGISGAVASTLVPQGETPKRPHATGQILVAVGSRAELTARQVTALEAEPGVASFSAPNGEWLDESFLQSSADTVVLRATTAPDGRVRNADEVAAGLARGAASLLATRPVQALVVTGGDTAMAVLDCLEQRVVRVTGDLLPGIPYSRIEVGGRAVWLVTKAGGFGTPDALAEIVRQLRCHSRTR